MSLDGDTSFTELPHLRLRRPARQLMPTPHAHGVIAVLFPCLMCDDLHAVELQDGTGDALAGLDVEDARHACFCGEGAGPKGESIRVLEAGESGTLGGEEGGDVGGVVEAVRGGGVDGFDAEGAAELEAEWLRLRSGKDVLEGSRREGGCSDGEGEEGAAVRSHRGRYHETIVKSAMLWWCVGRP